VPAYYKWPQEPPRCTFKLTHGSGAARAAHQLPRCRAVLCDALSLVVVAQGDAAAGGGAASAACAVAGAAWNVAAVATKGDV
jgi:hypothetical protein